MQRTPHSGHRALAFACLFGWAVSLFASSPQRAAIRTFDLETTEKLGREIFLQDQLAWVATDVLLAKVSMAELQKQGASGWVVDAKAADDGVVRFVRTVDQSVEAVYEVVFVPGKPPALHEPTNRQLTGEQEQKIRSLRRAEKAFPAAQSPWCGGRPNSVVLRDPHGAGYLVYFLRPKPSQNQVPIGGHYRMTVGPDAESEVRVDQLFVSCLTMDKKVVPNGSQAEAMVVSQIVAELPLETVVFLSLQEKLPIAVVGPSGKIWMVDEGRIREVGSAAGG